MARARRRGGRPAAARAPIGVFDSGAGGLTVLRALMRRLPRERFIYAGDTARVPYGSKSRESVRRFSLEIADFMARRRVKALVVACNTASALALGDLRRRLPFPVVGVIDPGARAAAAATRAGRVGVAGTEATVRSAAYERAIRRRRPGVKVFSRACPLFVPLAEEGWSSHPVAARVARQYLAPLRRLKTDVLVLGCTHYPLLKSTIRRAARGMRLIDSAEETARATAALLEERGLAAPAGRGGCVFYSSDDPEKFRRLGQRFLGRPLRRVSRLRVGEFK